MIWIAIFTFKLLDRVSYTNIERFVRFPFGDLELNFYFKTVFTNYFIISQLN